jgi:hypothetical protein
MLLGGCGAPPPRATHPPPSPTSSPSPSPLPGIEIALGAPGDGGALAPLVDGQEVTMVAGAQGGFHVWLAYRLHDVPAGIFTVERDAERVSDGAVVLRYRDAVEVAPGGDGWFTPDAPIPMFMCPTPIGVSVVGVPIAYRLRLRDAGDHELGSAGITLVPRCPDSSSACARICSG